MSKYNIDPVYRIPIENISCPACGKRYGHDETKVFPECQECELCCECEVKRIDADRFIQEYLDYQPL